MISRDGKANFFAAHYDWLVLGAGVVAIAAAGAFFFLAGGEDPDEAARAEAQAVDRRRPAQTGVKPVDLASFESVTRQAKTPPVVAEVSDRLASFLASERRVKCKCGRAISGDIKAVPKCPYCGEKQAEEKVVVLDADGDGLPDEWEKRFGLNPHDAADAAKDLDKDGFTNLEEFQAKTDPKDAKDHPDYLDSLQIALPLKETYLPFVFRKAMQVPGSWRCEFFDPKKKDSYGRRGMTLTAKVGEKIPGTDFTVKSHAAKSVKQAIKGAAGLTRTVDASEVVVERASDKKCVTLVAQQGKKLKFAPVDVQASLVYTRGTTQNLTVVPGSEIDLNGEKYRIVAIEPVGQGAKVTLEKTLGGKRRTITAP